MWLMGIMYRPYHRKGPWKWYHILPQAKSLKHTALYICPTQAFSIFNEFLLNAINGLGRIGYKHEGDWPCPQEAYNQSIRPSPTPPTYTYALHYSLIRPHLCGASAIFYFLMLSICLLPPPSPLTPAPPAQAT